jgi:hypothetical protein
MAHLCCCKNLIIFYATNKKRRLSVGRPLLLNFFLHQLNYLSSPCIEAPHKGLVPSKESNFPTAEVSEQSAELFLLLLKQAARQESLLDK